MMNKRSKNAGRGPTAYIELMEDGSDMWRAQEALTTLKAGGCGVIPTDTSYRCSPPETVDPGARKQASQSLTLLSALVRVARRW
jgi:hypothetical protein